MPTNVTPEYKKAEEAFRAAKTTDEKIERLEDMISLLPKHKGTDHLYADLKRRLAKLRKELESSGGRKAGGGPQMDIVREGAARVILVGPPNSGKSTILDKLTNAHPEVGDYPFATTQMQPGMVPFRDIKFQLIDCPPVTDYYMPPHLLGLTRGADAVLLVVNLAKDAVLDETGAVLQAFENRHVRFVREKDTGDRDLIRARILANKMDAADAPERLGLLREMIGSRLDILPLSCTEGGNVSEIPDMLFQWLGVVRVYTKIPGRKADMDHPYTVFDGGTVNDICALVHRDFLDNLKFARLWRGSSDPITVSRHEEVRDGDVVELHI